MKKLAALFTSSSQEMRQIRTVTVCAMMAAIRVVLGLLTVYITGTVRIGLSGIPAILVSYLFGPVMGGMFREALDVFRHLVKLMGPFMPGLTLVVMLKGLLYGCSLYKKPLTLWRVLAVQPVVAAVYNLLLNTLCLSFMYGRALTVLLAPRIIRSLIT